MTNKEQLLKAIMNYQIESNADIYERIRLDSKGKEYQKYLNSLLTFLERINNLSDIPVLYLDYLRLTADNEICILKENVCLKKVSDDSENTSEWQMIDQLYTRTEYVEIIEKIKRAKEVQLEIFSYSEYSYCWGKNIGLLSDTPFDKKLTDTINYSFYALFERNPVEAVLYEYTKDNIGWPKPVDRSEIDFSGEWMLWDLTYNVEYGYEKMDEENAYDLYSDLYDIIKPATGMKCIKDESLFTPYSECESKSITGAGIEIVNTAYLSQDLSGAEASELIDEFIKLNDYIEHSANGLIDRDDVALCADFFAKRFDTVFAVTAHDDEVNYYRF